MQETKAALEQEIDVAILLDQLGDVALETNDAAYQLSISLDGIVRRALGKSERLTDDQRERLLQAVEKASENNAVLFSHDEQALRDFLAKGFGALKTLVMLWSEDDIQQRRHHPHYLADAQANARIFQNALHNRCLAEEIEARASARLIADMKITTRN